MSEEKQRVARSPYVSDESEWVLIRECQRGRTRAFEPLVLSYQGEATAIAEAMLADSDDAADAVQEAFVRAYRGLGRLAAGSAFGPWFRSILRNLCIDELRSSSRRRQQSLTEDVPEAAIEPIGTQGIEQAELSEAVWTALRTISADHREILVLKEMEGMSYREIARTLRIAEGTVASRVFHARAALKLALQHAGFDFTEEGDAK